MSTLMQHLQLAWRTWREEKRDSAFLRKYMAGTLTDTEKNGLSLLAARNSAEAAKLYKASTKICSPSARLLMACLDRFINSTNAQAEFFVAERYCVRCPEFFDHDMSYFVFLELDKRLDGMATESVAIGEFCESQLTICGKDGTTTLWLYRPLPLSKAALEELYSDPEKAVASLPQLPFLTISKTRMK